MKVTSHECDDEASRLMSKLSEGVNASLII
jgi:hypothetical protein